MNTILFLLLLMSLALLGMVASPFPENVEVGAMGRTAGAKYLGISTRKLDDLLSSGDIKKLKLGRKTLIRKIDLDAFLEQLAEGDAK